MEINVFRYFVSTKTTISQLTVNNEIECYVLEDVERGLKESMTLQEIESLKIFGKTAIPAGRYRVVISYSPRFKRYLPEILGVKGFAGIRIHPGNFAEDTEGCLLPGIAAKKDMVTESVKAFNKLFNKMKAIEKTEEIWINIISIY